PAQASHPFYCSVGFDYSEEIDLAYTGGHLYGDECMGVPIEGGSSAIRRHISIRKKPGTHLPLQV
ncbi:hypothetical protein PanWU01x14_276750, partial [Parasponia andersonii]